MATYRQGTGETHQVKALGPTERADGTPLGVDEISHYVRTLTYVGGLSVEQNVQLIEDANTPEYDGTFDEIIHIDDQAPGTYQYTYRTVDTGGRESVESNVAELIILPPFAIPNPPQIISFV